MHPAPLAIVGQPEELKNHGKRQSSAHTDQIHNGTLRIDNPPAYFMFGVNIPTPNHGADVGLIYRQCFVPVTVLYDVIKDPSNPADGGVWLYAESGKYAVPPTQ